ncbi:AfsR/SARP family transcriptional regulator [Streptomyces sp. DH10]|uniref:AfsR/SARP family transcriptional regulator n=1 Tax=Streptomyces sp. DH10 TaxID=3040121 RepID=UPI0024428ADF|nr:BTAD domain-containing putative transcriptional regulator [Streptomyces sp. DH10]MDG9709420.1 BTAD domain-containing putative transcriptional regulator [Streptomyces sp. DH10]
MEFRLLGGIEAQASGEPVDLGPARQQTVLAALLMDVNRTVATDELVYRVWGEDPTRRAKDTLYSYLSRLRRALPGPSVDIRRRSGGYAVVADALAVDVHRFRHLVEEARRAADDAGATAAFQEALAVWRGMPFAGVDTPWFNAARDALNRERQAAELDCVDVRLRLGEHTALLAALSERSAADPLDERLAAQHILALYRCGRQADALAQYRRVRATLADELGIDPGADLQRLHQAILSGDPQLEPQPAAARVAAPVSVRAPAEAAWTVQCQLPLDVEGFAGRAELLERLEEELSRPGATPVVVSGSPGVGKSALAVHLGHRLRTAFPDGQWYIHLAGNSGRPRDPAEALSAMLRASGQDPQTIPEPLVDRAATFRSRIADRRVLLVLDDAAGAEQVRPLLPGTAGVAVLVTSRSDLRGLAVSHAARTVPLDVLAPAEARSLLINALGARRIDDEPEAAERLADLCANLPLALRIAAANLAARPGRSLTQYTAELADDERLAKLSVTGDHEAAVRTAFDHSHAALEPDTARLFALLGLHPGPDFTTEAAAAMLDSSLAVAEHLMDQLTTAGLVQHTAADRYQFHDLLRLYAAEHATADPAHPAAWQRLCDWYLATVDAATAFDYAGSVQLPRPRAESDRFTDRHQALAWLEAERANLTALIIRAAASGPREISWQLADQLRTYYYGRRHTAEWEAATTAALRAAEHDHEALAQAVLWQSLGLLRQHSGDAQAALEALHTAQEGYRNTGFTLGEVAILTSLAIHYALRGQMRQALECQQDGYALLRDLDRPVLIARALNTMGLCQAYLGEFDQAVERITEAIETCRANDRPSGTVGPLVNRAIARHGLGHYAEALADGTEALRLCQSHQRRNSEPPVHEILARIHRDTGRPDLARSHAEQALRTARAVGDPTLEADSLITLGSIHRLNGHFGFATTHLQQAVELTHRCGLRHQEADAHTQLALAHLESGAIPTAAHHAHQALTIARALELRPAQHRALTVLAAIAHASNTPTEAADHTAQAQRIQNETGYHPSPADEPK